MASHRSGRWSQAEDANLMQLVQNSIPLSWVCIARALGTRTPKQCRERYHQNLKPTLNHDPITPEEGLQIERLVDELGKRWAEIARRLHDRSDNAVKNWWNGSQNRRKRMDRRRADQSVAPGYDVLDGYQCVLTTGPLPRPGCSPSPVDRRNQIPWPEAHLPSPCASESPECESTSSHYTTSPARVGASAASNIELPPLRAWSTIPVANPSVLPSLRALASPELSNIYNQRCLPLPNSHHQIPTAQNSPLQEGQERDSRMNVAALLG